MTGFRLAALPDADDDAMRRLAGGDDEALASLFERYRGRVFGFLYHLLGDETAAEDLLGEAFLRVHAHRRRYRPGRGFEPWLFAIARNLARDELRRRRVRGRVPDPDPDTPGHEETFHLRQAVRRALLALPEDQRTALVLRECHGWSYREVGRVLGCAEEAARARAYRARSAMRRALTEMGIGE